MSAQENKRFAKAYEQIRAKVIAGAFAPGKQIRVNEIAAAAEISTTPAREVLSRLVGEGLIEDRPGYGFFVPLLSSFQLIDLYSLAELCLLAAAKGDPGPTRPSVPSPGALRNGGADPALIFRRILDRSANRALIGAGSLALDRLAGARWAEGFVLSQLDAEQERLAKAAASDDPAALAHVIRSYHRSRRRRADQIAYVLATATRPGPENIPDMI